MNNQQETEDITELDKKYGEERPSAEFSKMLEEAGPDTKQHQEVAVGKKVKGTIQKIDDTSAFVDFGGRSEAVIDLQELRSENGELNLTEGDSIEAIVSSLEGEIRLTRSLRSSNKQVIREAHENGLPVDGRVTGFNKGGLVVNLGGLRAFCPLSQIEMGFCQNPESYAGKTLSFKIIELRGGGRNLVVSHRAILEEEAKARGLALREKLNKGDELDGKVTRLERFGAFVDIGGVEGLVHVSEISHTRVNNPGDVLKTGQTIKVKILDMKDLGGDKERISLSIKALEPDPWSNLPFQNGQVISGKVVSIQNFGAFVEVAPGIEGLVHISQLTGEKRVNNPSEVVTVGQEVQVRVQEIDRVQHRISLSMRAAQAAADQEAEQSVMAEFQSKERQKVDEVGGSMADALRKAGLL
ncbi:MAG: 30S ribosomal protein S1 [Gemmatimonadetes bacterium]|nr:30S ribosomal protein S1 [Gemmatimonadota bacterium]|tara:strand:- start:7219 stop:8454 length:1236 start_codon:yes stop_codon:yes gene_type:complete